MKTTLKVTTAAPATLVMVMAGGLWYVVTTGLSARPAPGSIETRMARAVRRWAVPRDVRDRTPPLPSSADAIAEARSHFARYCATCHANDGSGEAR
jgi:mono/diheme cytochrome c family protein